MCACPPYVVAAVGVGVIARHRQPAATSTSPAPPHPPQGKTIDDLSDDAIRDASQWCKQGSIEGCKKASVVIVYTPWANLRKEGSMAVGQVGFHNERAVRKYVVPEKDREVLRRLEKTLEERMPDLGAERKARDEEERARMKAATRERAKEDKAVEVARKREKEERSYDRLFKKDKDGAGGGGAAAGGAGGSSAAAEATEDATAARAFEDDFM